MSQQQSQNSNLCPEFNELYNEIKINCNQDGKALELFRSIAITFGCDPDNKNLKLNEITMGLHGLETLINNENWQLLKQQEQIKKSATEIGINFMHWNQLHSICKGMVEKWKLEHKFSIKFYQF